MTDRMLTGLMMDDFQLSLTSLVERAEQLSAVRPVVSRRPDGSLDRTTLGECARRARQLAGGLAALGIRDGDRVATLLWNQADHLELYFAVPLMGAVIHTLNPRLNPDELSYIAADAEDRVIVVDESLRDVLDSVDWEFEHVIVVSHSGSVPGDSIDYESLVASAEPISWPPISERRAAAMCCTSGTTGRPKGVVHSHRVLVLHSLAAALPDVLGISSRDVILPAVPMFHVNAWGLPYTAALAGAALVLPGPRLDSVGVLDLLASERVTFTAGVPTVWMSVLEPLDAEPDRWDLRALQRVNLGGAAAPRSLLEGFDRHGLTIIHGWGMTETSPLGTVCRLPSELDAASPAEQYDYRARHGVAIPFVELRARGEDGELVPWNDRAMGELEVRGPWVAAGYHREVSADKFTDDGWFRTGDVVRIDQRGCIRICTATDAIRNEPLKACYEGAESNGVSFVGKDRPFRREPGAPMDSARTVAAAVLDGLPHGKVDGSNPTSTSWPSRADRIPSRRAGVRFVTGRRGRHRSVNLRPRAESFARTANLPRHSLAPWLVVEQFEYETAENGSTVLELIAGIEGELGAPAGAALFVQRGAAKSLHPALACVTCRRCADDRPRLSESGLLWQASFAVPLEVVEFPSALFELRATDRPALALPAPARCLKTVPGAASVSHKNPWGAQFQRLLATFAAGVTVAATTSVAGVAMADTTPTTIGIPTSPAAKAGSTGMMTTRLPSAPTQGSPADAGSLTPRVSSAITAPSAPTHGAPANGESVTARVSSAPSQGASASGSPTAQLPSAPTQRMSVNVGSTTTQLPPAPAQGAPANAVSVTPRVSSAPTQRMSNDASITTRLPSTQTERPSATAGHKQHPAPSVHTEPTAANGPAPNDTQPHSHGSGNHAPRSVAPPIAQPLTAITAPSADRGRSRCEPAIVAPHTLPRPVLDSTTVAHCLPHGMVRKRGAPHHTKHSKHKTHAGGKSSQHRRPAANTTHASGGAGLSRPQAAPPDWAQATLPNLLQSTAPDRPEGTSPDQDASQGAQTSPASASDAPTGLVAAVTFPVATDPSSSGLSVYSFSPSQLAQLSSLGGGIQPPAFLIPIYKAAGRRYHVPWQILAAINSIETDYGRDLSVSSAGAIGWMQFMPETWARYAVDADGNGRLNPYDPRDAIFTAARYLAANGAASNLPQAIFAYNHAQWYVAEVLARAQLITDTASVGVGNNGYWLPGAGRYMHGRTVDGGRFANPIPGGWQPERLDMGYDGTFTSLLDSPVSGTVTYASRSFSNWGGYIEIQASTAISGLASSTFYFAEGLDPTVQAGQQVTAGQPIAIASPSPWNGISGNIEWGLAAPGAVGAPTNPVAESGASDPAQMVTNFAIWAVNTLGIAPPASTDHAGYA